MTSRMGPPWARRVLRRLAIGVLAALGAAVLVVGVAVCHHLVNHGRTPAIRDAEGREVPGGVASLERITLGGVPQSMLVRGRSTSNPVLLFLHGGPGLPAMCFAHAWQRPLEDDFVVVQWDRRGAGKSYFGDIPPRHLTVRRLLEDTYELANILRGRFGGEGVILVGHSWGSYLGMLAVRERPDLFRAYVGVGQLTGDDTADARARLEFVRREAARRDADEALRDLDARGAAATFEWVVRLGGQLKGSSSWWRPLVRLGLAAPECTLADGIRILKGLDLYGRSLRYDVPADTPYVNVTSVALPVYMVGGRLDYTAPSETAERYLTALRAPRKGFFWFESSAHYPFLDEPERFAQVMRRVAAETAAAPAR